MVNTSKETFRIPWENTAFLTEMVAGIRVNSGIRVTKTDIVAGLLSLLKAAKINTKKVHSVDDIINQFKAHIRKGRQ